MLKQMLIVTLIVFCTAAFAGNEGGGGGNSPRPDKMSWSRFKSFGKYDLRNILKLIFQTIEVDKSKTDVSLLGRVEVTGQTQKLVNSVRKKLFSGKVSIYEVMRTAHLDLQRQSCVDPLNQKFKDGSANIHTHTVCLSFDRLSARGLSSQDFALYMVALAAHEYSHLVLTNEAEAIQLQKEIIAQIRLGDPDGINIQNAANFSRPAGNIIDTIDLISETIDRDASYGLTDFGLLCSRLNLINTEDVVIAQKLQDAYFEFGIFAGGTPLDSDFHAFTENFGSVSQKCDVSKPNQHDVNDVKSTLKLMRSEMVSIAAGK